MGLFKFPVYNPGLWGSSPDGRSWTGYGSTSGGWTSAAYGIGMPAPAIIDMEELEDSAIPVYMRESGTFRAYLREKQRQADLERMGLLSAVDRQKNVKPKWRMDVINHNAWRENIIDNKTIYSFPEAVVLDAEHLPPKSRPPSPPEELPTSDDTQVKLERKYIYKTRTGPRSAELTDFKRFWAQTIKQYNRPLDSSNDIPYRSPRAFPGKQDDVSSGTLFMKSKEPEVESITKVPSNLKGLPRKLKENKCKIRGSYSHEFCDVLGPSACKVCIEVANRKIAGEVQRAAFPELDCTVTTLVAPKLAKFMVLGERSVRSRQRKRTARVAKASILKLPALSSDAGAKFGRAGIERTWENNAKIFYAANRHSIT